MGGARRRQGGANGVDVGNARREKQRNRRMSKWSTWIVSVWVGGRGSSVVSRLDVGRLAVFGVGYVRASVCVCVCATKKVVVQVGQSHRPFKRHTTSLSKWSQSPLPLLLAHPHDRILPTDQLKSCAPFLERAVSRSRKERVCRLNHPSVNSRYLWRCLLFWRPLTPCLATSPLLHPLFSFLSNVTYLGVSRGGKLDCRVCLCDAHTTAEEKQCRTAKTPRATPGLRPQLLVKNGGGPLRAHRLVLLFCCFFLLLPPPSFFFSPVFSVDRRGRVVPARFRRRVTRGGYTIRLDPARSNLVRKESGPM